MQVTEIDSGKITTLSKPVTELDGTIADIFTFSG
jgi:hypothetical protein